MKLKKLKAISGFEFMIVVCILFAFFLIFIDLMLLFRQIYVVQASNDEIYTKIKSSFRCSDTVNIRNLISKVNGIFYSRNDVPDVSDAGGGAFEYVTPYYKVTVKCSRTGLVFGNFTEYNYNGLLMFRGKKIFSSFTSSASYY